MFLWRSLDPGMTARALLKLLQQRSDVGRAPALDRGTDPPGAPVAAARARRGGGERSGPA
jgi:hypothetical protein